ncbi:MAG: hypothetical protein WDO69_09795 [Pseudomonadota bacterium]
MSVLSHVTAEIAQKENVATKALSYILNQSASARAALEAHVERYTGRKPRITRVANQEATGPASRPDLILLDERGEIVGVLEAKFWAALTTAQPVEYLRRLEGTSNATLVMLAPRRRLPKLRAELVQRCSGLAVVEAGPWCLKVNATFILLLSWDELLGALKVAVADDQNAASDVHQLAGLCARFDSEGFVPLSREDLEDTDVPRRMLALAQLSSDIMDAATRERISEVAQLVTTKGLKAAHYSGATGRYGAFSKAGFWLGLSFWQWAKRGGSPLWLRFARDDWSRADLLRTPFLSWTATVPQKAYTDDEDGAIRIPLPFRPDGARETIISDAMIRLREINEILEATELPPLGAPPAREALQTEPIAPQMQTE